VEWIESLTERTTAVTDVALAALALACVALLGPVRRRSPLRGRLWTSLFLLLALGAGLGALAHGLVWEPGTLDFLWQGVYLALGFCVALFGVAAVLDGWGEEAARKLLLPALGVGLAFYLATRLVDLGFLLFILYEALFMLGALALYGWLAREGRPGAPWMAAGIALSIAAAVIQAEGSAAFTLVWPFDANGVFHLVQLAGAAVLVHGCRQWR